MTNTRINFQNTIARAYIQNAPKRKISAKKAYFIKQKIVGIISTALVIAGGIWIKDFATIFFGLLFSFPLIFSKRKILMTDAEYWNEDTYLGGENHD